MQHTPPYRVPGFGWTLAACHGIPALVMTIIVILASIVAWETASHFVKPVTLKTIWIVPSKVTVAQMQEYARAKARDPNTPALTKMHKTGEWSRSCPGETEQTFVDEQGVTEIYGGKHEIDVPSQMGPFIDKSRGIQIPTILAAAPGVWKLKANISSHCNWLEWLIPITGMTAEATFEIVP